jgi:hypothetical protein
MAECSYGSKDFRQYVNLPKDHGIYFQDTEHPLLNANDHEADKNILQFGRCISQANPANLAADVLSNAIPILGLAKQLQKAVGCEGCKCSPKTLVVWQNTDEKNHIDGVDGITSESYAMCFYGGKITIHNEDAATMISESSGMDETASIDNHSAVNYYTGNMNTAIPDGATDSQGMITDASLLTGFSNSSNDITQEGNAAVATYNASVALNAGIPFEDMILANDLLDVSGGTLADSMQTMQTMYESMGYQVKQNATTQEIPFGAAAIVGTVHKGKKKFYAMNCSEEGKLFWLGGTGNAPEETDEQQKMMVIR